MGEYSSEKYNEYGSINMCSGQKMLGFCLMFKFQAELINKVLIFQKFSAQHCGIFTHDWRWGKVDLWEGPSNKNAGMAAGALKIWILVHLPDPVPGIWYQFRARASWNEMLNINGYGLTRIIVYALINFLCQSSTIKDFHSDRRFWMTIVFKWAVTNEMLWKL